MAKSKKKGDQLSPDDIGAVKISVLDPAKLEYLSAGQVMSAHTYDKKGRPIPQGLFCERIFGTERSYSCRCGKYYNSSKNNGVTCPKCGVTVEDSSVRRQRQGHIELTEPVVHIWYRSLLATFLNIPPKTFNDIVLCKKYIVLDPGTSKHKVNEPITPEEYLHTRGDYGIRAKTGGKVVKQMLEEIDLKDLYYKLRESKASRRVSKRLRIVRDLMKSGVDPLWMILEKILVLPPALRPVLFMADGTVTSSDLNDLYARVINRNKRLKHFKSEKAPDMLILNDRRLLQLSVDALLQNGKTMVSKDRTGKRVLKSLSDMIEKKTGRLRRNLLGKRVDFSGRSVIVPGPTLKLHQCGVPKDLAMDIFRPFVYSQLVRKGYAPSLKHARRLVDLDRDEAMEALEEVIEEKVVLLNRAPSLHRLSFQAFYPVLVEGKALRLHPFTCSAFNGDFDGDQMGIHLPLSNEAQIECRLLAGSIYNIFSPATGKPVAVPSQEVVLGIYYLTKDRDGCLGEGKVFGDRTEVETAFQCKAVGLHAKIKVRVHDQLIDTTVGRVLFGSIFPSKFPFNDLNKTIRKKDIGKLVEKCYEIFGHRETVALLDKLKDIGFYYATMSGISICADDATVPMEKWEIIEAARKEVGDIKSAYNLGQISEAERHNKVVEVWTKATEKVTDEMMVHFGVPAVPGLTDREKKDLKEWNSIFMMADSGARGSREQIRQLAGMRGLMAKPNGEIVEIPIVSNLKEGQTYMEYLLASHGARKARADGALKTANAGYFTRRLVEAAHYVVIREDDCGSLQGIELTALSDGDNVVIPLEDRLYGRVSATDVRHPDTHETVIQRGKVLGKLDLGLIEAAGVAKIEVRSPITCKTPKGVCATCYGLDISTGRKVEIGEAVGIIAAQSIGEPGTQLTLRSHHHGGIASGGDSKSEVVSPQAGVIVHQDINTVRKKDGRHIATNRSGRIMLGYNGKQLDLGTVPYGAIIIAEDGVAVEAEQTLVQWDPHVIPIVATVSGAAVFMGVIDGITMRNVTDNRTGLSNKEIISISGKNVPRVMIGDRLYYLPVGAILSINGGDFIEAGDVIARTPKTAAMSMDITQGLPKVLQLLEVRRPENTALLSEISGKVEVMPPNCNGTIVMVKSVTGVVKQYLAPIGKPLNVHSGDMISAGEAIVDGIIDPQDVLRIWGPVRAASFIVDEVQKVYVSQGVSIADKHLEVIARQMIRMVQITDPGDTDFVTGETVSKEVFLEKNMKTAGRHATAAPTLIGLKKMGASSDSWLSCASFESTAKALSDAAIKSQTDYLEGTKENVILGRLVPVGTGYPVYRQTLLKPSRIRRHSNCS